MKYSQGSDAEQPEWVYGDLPEPTEKHERMEDHNLRGWKAYPGSQVWGVCCVECGFRLIE